MTIARRTYEFIGNVCEAIVKLTPAYKRMMRERTEREEREQKFRELEKSGRLDSMTLKEFEQMFGITEFIDDMGNYPSDGSGLGGGFYQERSFS